ncbi:MAG: hypothetical protein ABWY49_00080 [Rhizobium sp.]
MTPLDVIQKLIATNPAVAKLILAGMSVFAAAAIVLSFKIDTDTAVLLGGYVIAFSFVVTILAGVLDNTLLTKLIDWVITTILLLLLIIVIYGAVLPKYSPFAPPVCIIRFWQPCGLAEDQASDRNAAPVAVKPVPETIAEAGTAAPATVSPNATTPANVNRGDFTILVQFAGFRREDVTKATVALKALGWKVPEAARGGERTSNAINYKEIRYRSAAEKLAADQLAAEINAMGIASDVTTVQQSAVAANTLELWISL